MKIINYVFYVLAMTVVAEIANSCGSKREVKQNMIQALASNRMRTKRPFCNAFTGCGKRSANIIDQNELKDYEEGILDTVIYKAIIRSLINDQKNGESSLKKSHNYYTCRDEISNDVNFESSRNCADNYSS